MNGEPTFGGFLRKFGARWFTRMSGGASVPLTAAAIYFSGAPLKFLFAFLAASCLLAACYQVWRDSVGELQAKIAGRSRYSVAETMTKNIDDWWNRNWQTFARLASTS